MNIAVFGNTTQIHAASAIYASLEVLARTNGLNVVLERQFAEFLEHSVEKSCKLKKNDTLPADSDMLISFGGDGTFLRAVRWAEQSEIPVLGINTGHLGYLAAMSIPTDSNALCRMICRKEWAMEQREMLQVSVSGAATTGPAYPFALNEVALLKDHSATTISCSASLGDRHLATYPGDGLLVCTPTGSTAYNLSAGGPIVQPSLGVWVISPIASHTLTLRPLVVSTDQEIRITVASRTGLFQLALDGISTTLPDSAIIHIKRAPFKTTVVRPQGCDWLNSLSEKLLWGAQRD